MMNEEILRELISKGENTSIEFKSVLPPSKVLAPNIAAFTNTNGGHIIIGVSNLRGKTKILGLDSGFQVESIINKALSLLSQSVNVKVDLVILNNKRVYVIDVPKGNELVYIGDRVYERKGSTTILKSSVGTSNLDEYNKYIKELLNKLDSYISSSTSSGNEFFNNIKSSLLIIQRLSDIMFPDGIDKVTSFQEGILLSRLLLSSTADNFEYYMSNILLEIYLAKPQTLKTANDQITIKEVLDCNDLNEFVVYISKKKIDKLQKGSVKGFLSENKIIKSLNILDMNDEKIIEDSMQIRHLYTHKNGVVDKKFIQNTGSALQENDVHYLSMKDFFKILESLSSIVSKLDSAAKTKYNLSNRI